MARYASLAELLQANNAKGLGDSINAGTDGFVAGKKMADDSETRKQDFQAKLRELGILESKNANDMRDTDVKIRAQDANEIPADATGVPSLMGLGKRPVGLAALTAQVAANAKSGGDTPNPFTPGEEALDKAFAKDNADEIAYGNPGEADTAGVLKTNVDALGKTSALRDGYNRATGLLPDMFKDIINPGLADVEATSRSAVLSRLRATLGAQFTKDEGERIFSQTFNPRLPAEMNQKRIARLSLVLGEMGKHRALSIDYFRKNGTLKGFTGQSKVTRDQVMQMVDQDTSGDTAPVSTGAPSAPNTAATGGKRSKTLKSGVVVEVEE